jgi:uncharacterized membrane protein (UPF0127 family)
MTVCKKAFLCASGIHVLQVRPLAASAAPKPPFSPRHDRKSQRTLERSMHRLKSVFAVLVFLLFSAIPALALDQAPMHLPVDGTALTINSAKGDIPFEVEIADTEEERERGLMFRTDLKDNSAMLFVFDKPRLVTMWMENTPSALDMLFLDEDGRISTIRENAVPFSRSVISSGRPVRYVVEVKAGTAKRLGLTLGDKVRHPAIAH